MLAKATYSYDTFISSVATKVAGGLGNDPSADLQAINGSASTYHRACFWRELGATLVSYLEPRLTG